MGWLGLHRQTTTNEKVQPHIHRKNNVLVQCMRDSHPTSVNVDHGLGTHLTLSRRLNSLFRSIPQTRQKIQQ